MKPKILIDTVSLLSPLTGIGRYTYEISKLLENDTRLKKTYFYGYFSRELLYRSKEGDFKYVKQLISKFPLFKKFIRKCITFSSKFFTSKYDLYWQPNFIPNKEIIAKKVITSVHDFSFILHKEFHPKERIEYFENNFFQNIYRSDMIITGSEFSKREILQRLDFKASQVKVIYHGLNHKLFKVLEDRSIDFKLPKKFIFSVGSIEPRKNLLGLLQAYNLLDKTLKESYHLVLAGFKGWENKEIMELIELNKSHIHYLGFLSDEDLVKTYNLASLFVFPSFYEGFGLPVLEAMACGTPVVCSDYSSLPEVGGDAVVYCNPKSIEDIKEKMEYVLKDATPQDKMQKAGIKRAKNFTWEKSAKEHLKVFEEVLQS